MAVNIFGEGNQGKGGPGQKGVPGIGFKLLDDEGNYDLDGRRLANVATPEDDHDAVTLAYANELYSEAITSMSGLEAKFARVEEDLDEVKDVREGLEVHKVNSDERYVNLNALVHSDRQEALDRIALSERRMVARRTELSRDTAKVADLCNELERRLEVGEDSIEIINTAITSLLIEGRTMGSVLSTATGDITINTSEIEHIKVMVERLKESKADRGGDETLSSALSVIGDKMSTLEISLGVLENKLNTLDGRVDGVVREKVRASIETRPRRSRRSLPDIINNETSITSDGSIIDGANPSNIKPGLPPHAVR
jgi:hypothetical protein